MSWDIAHKTIEASIASLGRKVELLTDDLVEANERIRALELALANTKETAEGAESDAADVVIRLDQLIQDLESGFLPSAPLGEGEGSV